MKPNQWSILIGVYVLFNPGGRKRKTANAWVNHPQQPTLHSRYPRLRTRQTNAYHRGRRHHDHEISSLFSSAVDFERNYNNTKAERGKDSSAQRKSTDLLPQAFVDAIQSLNTAASHPTDARRIFHGRGGYHGSNCEHLTLDYFPHVYVLTSFDIDVSSDILNQTQSLLSDVVTDISSNAGPNSDDESRSQSFNFVYQFRGRDTSNGRQLCKTTLLAGCVPTPHIVTEVGGRLKYYVNILNNQNHGLFLDMLEGRKWVLEHSKDKRVLNMFAYTCAFSIAASSGGAAEVVNIDMAKGALKSGQKNHKLNAEFDGPIDEDNDDKSQESQQARPPARVRFLAHDIFKSWGKISKLGPYDVVIVDPPSYQKGSFIASKDYAKIIRRLPQLVTAERGCAVLCLNAPELSTSFLHELMIEMAPEFRFVKRVSNPRTFPVIDEERALKILIYERNGASVTSTTARA